MQARHDKLTLEAARQHRIGVAELAQRQLDDVDRIHPAKQRRVGLGDLHRNLGPLPPAGGPHQRLFEPPAGGLAPCTRVRPGERAEHRDPLAGRGRLGQRAPKEFGGRLGRAGLHRGLRRLPQAHQNPRVTCGLHTDQMGRNLTGRRPIGVQQVARAA